MKWLKASQFTPSWLLSRRVTSFERFFEMGQEESASPFLDAQAKSISRNLALKSAIASALLLCLSSGLRFFTSLPVWPIPLSFVYLLSGTPLLIAAVDDVIRRKDVNIDVLNTLAAFSALGIGASMEGGLLLVLFTLAGALEDTVTLKAKGALCAINEIAPTKAYIVEDGDQLAERAVDDVRVGEMIAVRAGEIVPLDGVIRKGEASISMAHMTGEHKPLFVGVMQTVVSGARVLDGSINVEVQLSSHDSTVAKLVQLITRAHSSKPKISQTFDLYSRMYALSVIGLTFFLLFFFPAALRVPLLGEEGAIVRSITFLITASPCALILAVPITYLSALGASARRGAILKGSVVFDRINACDVVAFDKTGTLTEGTLVVEKILPLLLISENSGHPAAPKSSDSKELGGRDFQEFAFSSDFDQETVLALAASLERHAVHPIARAIVESFSLKKKPFFEVSHVQIIPGEGAKGDVAHDGRSYALFIGTVEGVLKRMTLSQESIEAVQKEVVHGKVMAALSIENQGAYLFVMSDTIRSGSAQAVKRLHGLGKQVVMLTGDHMESAKRVGRSLNVDQVHSDLLPDHKVRLVASIAEKQGVLMVGDGINDAPALSRATVGVSMGRLSSAAAREASDVVLLNNDLDLIGWLFEKARQTKRVAKQNLVIAFASIFLGTASSLEGLLPLWAAVTIHEGSTLVVGLNALRLLRLRH
jgi:Zn2+/Cd2+-exporting ATPase